MIIGPIQIQATTIRIFFLFFVFQIHFSNDALAIFSKFFLVLYVFGTFLHFQYVKKILTDEILL